MPSFPRCRTNLPSFALIEELVMFCRDDVIRTLHRLAFAAFCGRAPWPCSRETNEALDVLLLRAGMKVAAPEHGPGTYTTPRDVAAETELLLYVIGHYDPCDFMEPADWDEVDEAYPRGDATREQCEPFYKRKIFAAYAQRYVRSGTCQ
jgi:hypothetical protein